jgi:hypothetical protein
MWFILKHTGINVCVPGVRAKTVLNCTCVPRGALSFRSIFRTMTSNAMNLGEADCKSSALCGSSQSFIPYNKKIQMAGACSISSAWSRQKFFGENKKHAAQPCMCAFRRENEIAGQNGYVSLKRRPFWTMRSFITRCLQLCGLETIDTFEYVAPLRHRLRLSKRMTATGMLDPEHLVSTRTPSKIPKSKQKHCMCAFWYETER